MKCCVFGSVKMYNSNANSAARKLTDVFHQHLQFTTTFIMTIKPQFPEDPIETGNITYGSDYFYTAFLTVNAYCTASSYAIVLSVCLHIQ